MVILRNNLPTVYKVVLFFTSIYTHTPSLTPNAHTHSHLHSVYRLRSSSNYWSSNHLILDIHYWTSAVIHLVYHIGLGFTVTHNLSYKYNLR